jgi:hypothetical protein
MSDTTNGEVVRSADEGLGQYLAVAFVSYQMGITFATALKRYGRDEPGEYWVALGAEVNRHFVESMNADYEKRKAWRAQMEAQIAADRPAAARKPRARRRPLFGKFGKEKQQ